MKGWFSLSLALGGVIKRKFFLPERGRLPVEGNVERNLSQQSTHNVLFSFSRYVPFVVCKRGGLLQSKKLYSFIQENRLSEGKEERTKTLRLRRIRNTILRIKHLLTFFLMLG